MAQTFNSSPNQAAIFDFIRDGKGSAIVEAVAGSGKTTTIIESLAYVPEGASVLMLAFNASIAKELGARIEALGKRTGRDTAKIAGKTFHSLGYGAIMKALNGTRPNVDAGKVRKLAKEILGATDYELYADFACKLVGLAKGQGIGALEPDTDSAWFDIIAHHDITLDSMAANMESGIAIARRLLSASNEAAKRGNLDFDDQLYLVLLWGLRLWQNDFVFIDEAQDTNPVRRALAKLALKPGGRLVAVGDRRQSIYGFTGASHDAMDLIEAEFNCAMLPLSVSYRCARNVIAKAQEIVPHIEAWDAANDGTVSTQSIKEALGTLTQTDAILCRQTAPLVCLAFKLIASGRGCAILGRDIAKGLTSLVEKQKAKGIDALIEKLSDYREREIARFMAKGEEQKADSVADKVDCIMTVIGALPETARTVPELVRKIESLFSDDNGVLTLSTIHKAKGKEWHNVAILEPGLMPSKWARQDWQYLQEKNLQYVAYTRAKENLIFLADTAEQFDARVKKEIQQAAE